MKILAIESSGMPASAAVWEDDCLKAEYTVHDKKTHSQTLLPLIDEVCRQLNLDKTSLDAVAVSAGPGSFTGLRIGSATAKGIGLALHLPLISVPTLEALATNFHGSGDLIVPMLDARRREVFTGIYTYRAAGPAAGGIAQACLQVLLDQTPLAVADLCEKLNRLCGQTGQKALLLGDGCQAYRDLIEEKLEAPHLYAPAHLRHQRAGSLAVRAAQMAAQDKLERADQHRPIYLRVSQAERVRKEKLEEGESCKR